MLRITDDAAHGCLLVEPEGRLTETDFEALTTAFNEVVNTRDTVPNLVIHARSFPGWADFGGLFGHVGFVRDHHRLVRRIALVSDDRILDLAPYIANRLLHAEIRHFRADALPAALDWVAERPDAPNVAIIPGLPDAVLGVAVRGAVTARDYAEVIQPEVERRLKDHARISLLYHVTPEFRSISPGAMWSDAKVGLTHLTRFARIALVSDHDWMRNTARVFAPLLPGELRVFVGSEYDAAVAWVGRAAAPGA